MRWFTTLKELRELLRRIQVHPVYFVVPVALSLLAAALDGVGLSLLIPLLRGVVALDFGFVREVVILRDVLPRLPQLAENSNVSIFAWLILIIFTAALLKNICKYGSAVSAAYVGRIATHNLRRLVFARYLSFGKLFFDKHSLGYLNQVLMVYTEQVAHPITQGYQLVQTIFSLAVYLVIMLAVSWKLTLLVLILIPLMNYSLRTLILKIRSASQSLAQSVNDFTKQAFNILSSIPLVKAYTNETAEEKRFAGFSEQVSRLEFAMNRGKQLIAPAQESMTLVAVLLVIVAMAWLTVRGRVEATAGWLVYFYVVMNAANTYGGVNRFWGIMAEVAGPLGEVQKMLTDDEKFLIRDGAQEFRGLARAIEFRELSFVYPSGREVLHDVSFRIPAGEMTALVGPTGAGKSTLINLLLRFYDTPPGQLLFDDVDIREFTVRSLRSHVALVSQDTQLFNDTLRHNIIYGLRDVSPERLQDVVRAARLEDFIGSLPQGLETEIGDHGVQLSGGEKQRVSIARALLKQADILLLDEATSALDAKTERLVQEAITEALRGKTSLVIAHRLSTIQHADKIVVLEEGRVVEHGTLEELLQAKGAFYEQWQAQKFY
ncbi:MAG TPA: ABC transporter ATP-binding protein [Candidatus Andersenbacteria bacterium]|nr:ABC transporter ATP-binding protein [Candidatus Andersenbacteria bacterium]